jgi:hypothetical protein
MKQNKAIDSGVIIDLIVPVAATGDALLVRSKSEFAMVWHARPAAARLSRSLMLSGRHCQNMTLFTESLRIIFMQHSTLIRAYSTAPAAK